MSLTSEVNQLNRKVFVYDIETLPNFFSAVFYNIDTAELSIFKIYQLPNGKSSNEGDEFVKFCLQANAMIGYNSYKFDYPVIHEIVKLHKKKPLSTRNISEILSEIIKYRDKAIESEFPLVRVENMFCKQLDLFKMKHYDAPSKSVSLKQLQANMRYPNIQEMSMGHNDTVKSLKRIKNLIEYNTNDTLSTYELYKRCSTDIELRLAIAKNYNLDNIHSDSEPSISRKIFAKLLSEKMNIPLDDLNRLRTPRSKIVFKDIILDYIKFDDPKLQGLLEFYKLQEIGKLKGFFKDIPSTNPGFKYLKKIVNREDIKVTKKKYGKTTKFIETCSELSINFKGTTHVFGNGGIHSKIKGLVVKSDDKKIILDFDVTSYYPKLSIVNGFKPNHLGHYFMELYETLFVERSKYPKKTVMNTLIKLMLNATYGLSNNEHCFMYDPQMTSSICINGQLLIMMLIEKMSNIPGVNCFASNTDGATFLCDIEQEETAMQISKEWEEMTGLSLDCVKYKEMYFRDVNSYIWIPFKGEPKLKGYFETDKPELHKNHSAFIIPIALSNYYIKGIPIEKTIRNHTDIYDFCKIVKSKKDSHYIQRKWSETGEPIDKKIGRIVRYYVCKRNKKINRNTTLLKIMPPLKKETFTELHKRKVNKNQSNIFDFVEDCKVIPKREQEGESRKVVRIFNKHRDVSSFYKYRVNYEYYIAKCKKVIEAIEGKDVFKPKNSNNYQLF